MKRPAHVLNVGRWRIMVRFGRYRFGGKLYRLPGRPTWSAGSFGAGLACGNWVRRRRP